MRLIDADALIEAHYDYCNTHHGEADIFWTWSLRLMKDAPTIEAEPVRRGRWAIEPGIGCKCTVCGFDIGNDLDFMEYVSYCPNCGARMEDEEL